MLQPAFPKNEADRLFELLSLEILDTEPDPDFDDIVQMAAEKYKLPIVLISLVDSERQWFKSKLGINECELPRSISFCGHAILGNDVFVVNNSIEDPRFSDNPLVTGQPFIKFYAGAPLINANGHALGTICLIDNKARDFDADEIRFIQRLARQVVTLLELRKITLTKLENLKEIKRLSDIVLFQKNQLSYLEKVHVLREMAAGICHEINNPLAVITLVMSSIKRSLAKDATSSVNLFKYIAKAEESAHRIGKIVNGLRTYARASETTSRELVNISDLLNDAFLLCEERLKGYGVDVFQNVPEDAYIDCNRSQLIQVLFNLIANSRDAVEKLKDRWIQVTARKDLKSKILLVRLTDSGTGIDCEIEDKIMLPFFTTKEVGVGCGLGLSICRSLIEDHGGSLEYGIYEGHTSFLIKLPLA